MFYGAILGLLGVFVIGLIVVFVGCAIIVAGMNDLDDEYRPIKSKNKKVGKKK